MVEAALTGRRDVLVRDEVGKRRGPVLLDPGPHSRHWSVRRAPHTPRCSQREQNRCTGPWVYVPGEQVDGVGGSCLRLGGRAALALGGSGEGSVAHLGVGLFEARHGLSGERQSRCNDVERCWWSGQVRECGCGWWRRGAVGRKEEGAMRGEGALYARAPRASPDAHSTRPTTTTRLGRTTETGRSLYSRGASGSVVSPTRGAEAVLPASAASPPSRAPPDAGRCCIVVEPAVGAGTERSRSCAAARRRVCGQLGCRRVHRREQPVRHAAAQPVVLTPRMPEQFLAESYTVFSTLATIAQRPLPGAVCVARVARSA